MSFSPGPILNLPFQFLTQILPSFSLKREEFCRKLLLESLSGNSDIHFWLRTSALECLGQWRSTGLVTVKWNRSPLPSSSNFPFHMFIIKRKCSHVVLKGFIFFFWVLVWLLWSYYCLCAQECIVSKLVKNYR